MGMKKTIQIDGKDVVFKTSAAIPRIYRLKFQRDIYKDLRLLEKAVGESDEKESGLDEFNTFSIYQVLPEIIKLWGLNIQTEAESKKNFAEVSGR
ncbi:MAG: hypothetical protein LUI13_14400 [Lachnospiraceae bacterium]|nr:hypothetical protein [Lachnospiraceae bacterium]